jgi:DNA end-binding protein Ku
MRDDHVLGMSTMLFADEIVDPSTIDELAAAEDVETTDRELEIAKQLIESLAGPFDPDKYRDEYRDEVLNLIERKAAGEEIAVQPEAEEEAEPVPDLMAALKASLDAVRDKEAAPADGNGASKAKAKAKKEPAKPKPKAKAAPRKKAETKS